MVGGNQPWSNLPDVSLRGGHKKGNKKGWGGAKKTHNQALIGKTNFLGRDRDQEIRLIKTYYDTETEK